MARRVEDLLYQNYSRIGGPILTPMLDWLLAVRAHFHDDLEQFLIFIAIALRTFADPRSGEIDFAAVDRGEVASHPSLLTNVRSIAASTGLPYETTRRKVDKLLALGWIERRGRGLAVTTKASMEFAEMRRRMLAMVASHYTVTATLVAQED